ncbi:MAG: hypothetical protein WCF68_12140, partial [Terriglobales bacterium]
LTAEDDLKNFRRTMALQATAEQRAAFTRIAQYTQAALDQLENLRKSLPQSPAAPALADGATALDAAVAKARAGNQNFLASFSDEQKSGLRDATTKLAKADSELDRQLKAFDQLVRAPKPEPEPVAALDKTLAAFQSEQLALAGEMSILFSPGQQLTFSLPQVTNAIDVASLSISIPASGVVSRTSAGNPGENGANVFSLTLVADLSELQLNVTSILRSALNRDPRCGERVELQDARLTPLAPASLVVANVHVERWICPLGPSQANSPMEAAVGDGSLEVKLTPSFAPDKGVTLASEITRVDAKGFLRSELRSGDLGEELRDQIAAALQYAIQKIADPKTDLPPAAQPSAALQRIQFDNAGADQLSLILAGQLQFSDEQEAQFAAQLKQRLAAQQTTPQ